MGKSKTDRIATLRKELDTKAVKRAEKIATDEPQVALLAGMLAAPAPREVKLSPYDKRMIKQLGLTEKQWLEAKAIK